MNIRTYFFVSAVFPKKAPYLTKRERLPILRRFRGLAGKTRVENLPDPCGLAGLLIAQLFETLFEF